MMVGLAFLSSLVSTNSAITMSIAKRACFGAGCYWGTDKFFKVDFGQKIKPGSIKSGQVGFMSASPTAKKNPSYREVCSGINQLHDYIILHNDLHFLHIYNTNTRFI